MSFAHSKNPLGQTHDLVEHLKSVAELAAKFAGKFGAADLGYWAGFGGNGTRKGLKSLEQASGGRAENMDRHALMTKAAAWMQGLA